MGLIEKVVPIIIRDKNHQKEILIFKHPIVGIQIVKETVEKNEPLEKLPYMSFMRNQGLFLQKFHLI